ncbi:head protein [Archangium lansingense]|uniref:Head protein n=1 Tax=Archangium lansingense TaxID=2995310 RepID=A0ABT3ZWJ4_9BACT|nr:head protein [Archangium lansinium]MCY1073773.1 head protein [Archangium lansinium]
MKDEAPTFEAINLLGLILEKTESEEEKELLFTAAEALRFIETTGQQYDFVDYRQDLKTEGPQMVIASFATRDEAEAWLKNHPKPPCRAAVLIADKYHTVYYRRDTNDRTMPSTPGIEFHLEEMMKDGRPPPPAATFDTREQARAWFYSLPERPSQAVIQLGGEPYLAAYHRNIDHLAFHPFSLVEGLKEWRKKMEQERTPEDPEPQS